MLHPPPPTPWSDMIVAPACSIWCRLGHEAPAAYTMSERLTGSGFRRSPDSSFCIMRACGGWRRGAAVNDGTAKLSRLRGFNMDTPTRPSTTGHRSGRPPGARTGAHLRLGLEHADPAVDVLPAPDPAGARHRSVLQSASSKRSCIITSHPGQAHRYTATVQQRCVGWAGAHHSMSSQLPRTSLGSTDSPICPGRKPPFMAVKRHAPP